MRKVVPDPSEKPIQEDSGHSSTDSESTPQQHSPNAEEEDGRLKIIEEDRVAAVASSQPTCSPPSSRYNTVTSVSSSTDSGFENSVSLDLLAKLQQAECQN
jgi:hypothetical protein